MSLIVLKDDRERDITKLLTEAGPQPAATHPDHYGKRNVAKRSANELVALIKQAEDEIAHKQMLIARLQEGIEEWQARGLELRMELAESLTAIDEQTQKLRTQFLGETHGQQTEKDDGKNHPSRKKRRV